MLASSEFEEFIRDLVLADYETLDIQTQVHLTEFEVLDNSIQTGINLETNYDFD